MTLLHSVAKDEYFDPLVDELVPICSTVEPAARLAVSELVARFRAQGVGCETDAARLGSVALRVLRESPCAVWSVVPGRDAIPRRILAATDLTPTGQAAVE